MEIKFERASINDVDVLINVRNKAFYAYYVKYGECPGYNNSKESMTNSILNRIAFKIVCNNQIIGNISVSENYDNTSIMGSWKHQYLYRRVSGKRITWICRTRNISRIK